MMEYYAQLFLLAIETRIIYTPISALEIEIYIHFFFVFFLERREK